MVDAGVEACCWASMPVILPYTCGLAGSIRRRAFQAAASSPRSSSFSSCARRQNSASGRKRAFSARAASCALPSVLMYSIAETLLSHVGTVSGMCLHLVRTSHLLDLLPGELGRILFKSSKRFFISLLRFLSAILWLMRSSGVRL